MSHAKKSDGFAKSILTVGKITLKIELLLIYYYCYFYYCIIIIIIIIIIVFHFSIILSLPAIISVIINTDCLRKQVPQEEWENETQPMYNSF